MKLIVTVLLFGVSNIIATAGDFKLKKLLFLDDKLECKVITYAKVVQNHKGFDKEYIYFHFQSSLPLEKLMLHSKVLSKGKVRDVLFKRYINRYLVIPLLDPEILKEKHKGMIVNWHIVDKEVNDLCLNVSSVDKVKYDYHGLCSLSGPPTNGTLPRLEFTKNGKCISE